MRDMEPIRPISGMGIQRTAVRIDLKLDEQRVRVGRDSKPLGFGHCQSCGTTPSLSDHPADGDGRTFGHMPVLFASASVPIQVADGVSEQPANANRYEILYRPILCSTIKRRLFQRRRGENWIPCFSRT